MCANPKIALLHGNDSLQMICLQRKPCFSTFSLLNNMMIEELTDTSLSLIPAATMQVISDQFYHVIHQDIHKLGQLIKL